MASSVVRRAEWAASPSVVSVCCAAMKAARASSTSCCACRTVLWQVLGHAGGDLIRSGGDRGPGAEPLVDPVRRQPEQHREGILGGAQRVLQARDLRLGLRELREGLLDVQFAGLAVLELRARDAQA